MSAICHSLEYIKLGQMTSITILLINEVVSVIETLCFQIDYYEIVRVKTADIHSSLFSSKIIHQVYFKAISFFPPIFSKNHNLFRFLGGSDHVILCNFFSDIRKPFFCILYYKPHDEPHYEALC